MPLKTPKPTCLRVRLADGDNLIEVDGWESGLAVGVVQSGTGYNAVLLMSGLVVASGFRSLKEAHAFNILLASHPKLFVGTPDVSELFERAGGRQAAEKIVLELRERAKKES